MCSVCDHPERAEIDRLIGEKVVLGDQCECHLCGARFNSARSRQSHMPACPQRDAGFAYTWLAFAARFEGTSQYMYKHHYQICLLGRHYEPRPKKGKPSRMTAEERHRQGLRKVRHDLARWQAEQGK